MGTYCDEYLKKEWKKMRSLPAAWKNRTICSWSGRTITFHNLIADHFQTDQIDLRASFNDVDGHSPPIHFSRQRTSPARIWWFRWRRRRINAQSQRQFRRLRRSVDSIKRTTPNNRYYNPAFRANWMHCHLRNTLSVLNWKQHRIKRH